MVASTLREDLAKRGQDLSLVKHFDELDLQSQVKPPNGLQVKETSFGLTPLIRDLNQM
jgi:hypothetical protein